MLKSWGNDEITLLSPAKINLFLHVEGKRQDGYHDLVSIMCCVGIYDTISIDFKTAQTSIKCSVPNVPEDETNLAAAGAAVFFKVYNKSQPLKIIIDKHIPVSAGLGGGSSNAAAVMCGLNQYYGFPIPYKRLISMGASLGADIPFFIYGKPAVARGIGEKLEPFEILCPYSVLLVNPGFEVSTAKIFKKLNLGLTTCKKKLTYCHFKREPFDIIDILCNDLETVTLKMFPEIAVIKKELLKLGAIGAQMTGSGPTVFGIFSNSDKAEKAKCAIKKNKKWKLFLTQIIV